MLVSNQKYFPRKVYDQTRAFDACHTKKKNERKVSTMKFHLSKAIQILLILVFCLILSGCGHQHEWVEATCTEPKTCSTCGETEGEPLGHSWLDATCTEPKICSVCGAKSGNSLGHTWIDATCTAPKTCSVCGATEGEPIDHTVSEQTIIREATCTETGEAQGVCSVCGATVTIELPMLDHTPGDWTIVSEATSTEPGVRAQYCTVCGAELTSESYELSPEEKEAAFKAECGTYSYDEIARDPDSHMLEQVYFTGEVIQVVEDGNDLTLRVDITEERYGWTDTIYVEYTKESGDPRILEDDIITLYGYSMGTVTYTSIFGASITIPAVYAVYIDS